MPVLLRLFLRAGAREHTASNVEAALHLPALEELLERSFVPTSETESTSEFESESVSESLSWLCSLLEVSDRSMELESWPWLAAARCASEAEAPRRWMKWFQSRASPS